MLLGISSTKVKMHTNEVIEYIRSKTHNFSLPSYFTPSKEGDYEKEEHKKLEQSLGVRLAPSKVASLVQMDRPGNVGELLSIARKAAAQQVDPAHFPAAFDAIAM